MKGYRLFLLAVALLAPGLAAGQGATITGVVRTDAGAALPAVTVLIEGTSIGAQTRDDGTYTITVPSASVNGQAATLVARRIGYRQGSARITLASGTIQQDFTLVSTAAQLSEVVVTALGVERVRSTLGTAQQQLSATEVNETRAQNVMQQIQGKVSGVQITSPGTQGGSTNVVIRGQNSITGNNQPLFIVDGVAVSNANRGGAPFVGSNTTFDFGNALNDLNPDDIASLSVLKGPNAAAIYGSRAANGVILITTRKGGNTGGRMRTEINTNLTFERPAILPSFQNRYGQGLQGEFEWLDGNYGGTNDGVDESWGPKMDGRLICQFDSPGAGTANCTPTPWVPQPDNVKDFFRQGVTMSTTVAVSGGTERASGRLSLGADNINGIFPNNLFQRRTASLTGAFRVNRKFSTEGSVQYIHNAGRNRPGVGYSGRNPLQSMFNWYGRQVSTESLKNYRKGGLTNGGPANREFNWNYSYHNNPFWIMEENPQLDDRDRLIGSVAVKYDFAEGMNATLRTGSDIYRLGIQQLFAPGSEQFINLAYNGGFRFVQDYRNDNNTDLTLTGSRKLSNWLHLNAVAGGNVRREYFNGNSQQTTGLTVPRVYNPSNAAVTPAIDQQIVRRQVQGLYGSAAFTINDWWTIEGTARNDWSSTLPEDANSYFYPSLNTSFVVTDAVPGLRSRALSSLKLRAATARVGSDAPVYSLVPVFLGESQRFGTQPQYRLDTRLANAELKPEITRSDEIGAELSMFNDRVLLDASAYRKGTRNQIFDVEISGATGFDRKWVNAGEISNKGIEALVTVNLVRSPRFGWNTTFNYARNRSRVVDLAPDVETIVLGRGGFGDVIVEARKGEPYGAIRGYKYQRDDNGNILVEDGYPLRESSLSVLGNIQPNWTGGWANQFKLGSISLNTLLDVKRGGNLYSVTQMFGEYAGVLEGSLLGREDDWDKPGVLVEGIDVATGQTNTKRISSEEYFHGLFAYTERYVYDASYVKLREVRLSYNLPETWASAFLRAREATISLTGRNLMMWKNVPNIDPEFAYSSRNDQGIEVNMSPNPRSIGFNLRIVP